LLLIAILVTIPIVLNAFSSKKATTLTDVLPTIKIVDVILPPIQPQEPQKSSAPPAAEIPDKPSMQKQVLTEREKATDEVPTQSEMSTPTSTGATSTATGFDATQLSGGGGTLPVTTNVDDGVKTTSRLDVMPQYPGGIENFYKYVGRNFKTPEDELASGTMIRVVVSFVIEKDGSMTDIQVIQNPGYGLDKEAIRVLKSLKVKWSPGFIAGQAVRTAYNLPIAVKAP